jgi:6-phosphogluconate dehydrogenase
MQLGMIGLGRMGANMVRRLRRGGHSCVVYARSADTVAGMAKEGAIGATSLADLVQKLAPPRVIWMMVPAATVDRVIADLRPLVTPGDILVDGGNSHYRDDQRRAAELAAAGVHYVDVGTSGGVWGLDRGYCLMIGGEAETVRRLDPLFVTLAPPREAAPRTPARAAGGRDAGGGGTAEHGYLHCGPHGAGHFVKMVHNGIEFGIMAAYAEGLNILHHANAGRVARATDAETAPLRDPEVYRYDLNIADIAELWRRGSVIGSWLLDLTADALHANPDLTGFGGRVADSGEGRWTIQAAVDTSVPAPVLTAALYARFSSRGEADFANRVLSAMRFQFGGHGDPGARRD